MKSLQTRLANYINVVYNLQSCPQRPLATKIQRLHPQCAVRCTFARQPEKRGHASEGGPARTIARYYDFLVYQGATTRTLLEKLSRCELEIVKIDLFLFPCHLAKSEDLHIFAEGSGTLWRSWNAIYLQPDYTHVDFNGNRCNANATGVKMNLQLESFSLAV